MSLVFLSLSTVHGYLPLNPPGSFIIAISRRNSAEITTKRRVLLQQTVGMSAISTTSNPVITPSSKRLSVFNALGGSSKFFVSFLAAIILLLTDSWAPLYYIVAAVSNGILSKVIKKSLKQPRPLQSDKGGYGMPSSHAQSFFFFLTVLVVHYRRIFPNGYLALLTCSILAVYAVVASSWRVTTRLHTTAQTVVGGVLGSLVAVGASRIELSAVQLLQRFFTMMTGELGTDHAVWTAKICITLAAILVICKREIQALIDRLISANIAGRKTRAEKKS